MTQESFLQILEENFKARPGSFMHGIHDLGRFDEARFIILCRALYVLCLNRMDKPNLDRVESGEVMHMVSHILKLFIFHLSPKDGYKMDGFPVDYGYVVDCLDVLTSVTHTYFAGGDPKYLEQLINDIDKAGTTRTCL